MTCLRSLTLAGIEWRTITILILLWQNIVVVRPEDGVDTKSTMPPDGHIRMPGKILSSQIMGSMQTPKKPRFLCLHGGGSNASRFEEELNVWPDYVLDKMELVFINGPFPSHDSSPVNEHFVWFSQDKLNGRYTNFDEGIAYIDDFMVKFGPFDGLIGFSQGSVIAGVLPGLQMQGVCLTGVEKIQHVVIISGAKFGGRLYPMPKLAETAYSSPINIPSLHIFGEHDIARPNAPELVEAYVDPLVIYHHGGHEVPKLDEEGLKIMYEFLKKINAVV